MMLRILIIVLRPAYIAEDFDSLMRRQLLRMSAGADGDKTVSEEDAYATEDI